MIEYTYNINANLTAKFECNTVQETIERLTELDQILRADTACGFCESENIQIRARDTQENFRYYEFLCRDCRATLQIHQKRDEAGMYVVQSREGKPLPNRGWAKFWERKSSEPREAGPEPRDEEVPQTGRMR